MRTPRPRPGRPRGRRPRRTARLRLTVLYGGAVFLACGATVLAVTYLVYGMLGNATRLPHPVLHLYKHGKVVSSAAVPPAEAAIRVAGLGQLSLDRPQLLIAAGIALAVIAVAAAAIGWLIAGRVLRPLRTITAAARRISASSLHERLALPGPDDELKELADTLDSLFARLEASFDAQRRFAASASHELRTPQTRERTLLQVTLADPAATTGTWQGRQPGTARLQRRAGTPHRSAAHPGQQRSRPRPARARRPGRHHQRCPGRRPPRGQPPGPARPGGHPARRPRR
jgi:signal transduction histidine kinase